MCRYEVNSPGGRKVTVTAKNSQQAKRLACRLWGTKPSCPWVGVPGLSARKLPD